jgi:aspartate/methionine/tyrosine aminotransferase
MEALEKETSLELYAKAKALEAQGKSVIHLEIGEPDFDTPVHIKDAGIGALRDGYTHYGPSAGLPEAREAIARYISRDRGVPVTADQVVVTPGAKSVIFYTMLALIEDGDEVLYPNPGFPNYEMTIRMLGGRDVPVPLVEEKGFSIDLDRFESLVTKRTKLCVINSPHNPTGGMLSREVLQGILDIAAKYDFYILSDEIYSKMVYDGSFQSMYALPGAAERTILLDGHSKTYAMTGWRLGYAVMPKELVPVVSRAAGNVTSCTASFTQIAGIEALQGPQDDVRAMVEEFRARRDIIVRGLNDVPGFRCHKPAGAFYVFPNIRGTNMSSREMSRMLLDTAGVAVLSGTTFGAYGEGYIRLSYANSQENIARAIERIAAALRA